MYVTTNNKCEHGSKVCKAKRDFSSDERILQKLQERYSSFRQIWIDKGLTVSEKIQKSEDELGIPKIKKILHLSPKEVEEAGTKKWKANKAEAAITTEKLFENKTIDFEEILKGKSYSRGWEIEATGEKTLLQLRQWKLVINPEPVSLIIIIIIK